MEGDVTAVGHDNLHSGKVDWLRLQVEDEDKPVQVAMMEIESVSGLPPLIPLLFCSPLYSLPCALPQQS